MAVPEREFHHLFRNKMYRVKITNVHPNDGDCNADGDCDAPDTPKKKLRVNKNLGDKKFMIVSLDESVHACQFDLDNEVVGEIANSIGNFLWKLGFRHVKDDEEIVKKVKK